MVHLMKSAKNITSEFNSGSIFYPGRFGARIKRVDWSQADTAAEVTDQYGDISRITLEQESEKAHIEGDDGVYTKFVIKELDSPDKIVYDLPQEDKELIVNKSVNLLPFSERQCQIVGLVGGKGASLSKLTHRGLNVPQGFCLTTNMFQQAISQHPEVQKALVAIKNLSSSSDLENLCKIGEDQILASGIAKDFMDDIEAMGNGVMGSIWETRLAIRSSGVDEDGAGTSTAGQNETLLGIIGKENVRHAIEQCWSSLHAYRSVQYRHQNGQPLITSMGVVIQKMIPAAAAGVLFTADPLTGNPGKYTITASWGLGEAVVSGHVDPDTIVVDVLDDEEVPSSIDIKQGIRTEQIVMDPKGGTKVVPVDPGHEACCLSQEQIVDLVTIGRQLKSKFGAPQDIEFAVADQKVYILQCRPITTTHRLSDWELEHEYDSAQPTNEEISTKANFGEVLPGAVTPLTRSTLLKILDANMQVNACKKADLRHAIPEATAWVTTIQHHGLLNVMDGILKCPQKTLSATSKAIDFAVFGHEVTQQEWLDKAVQRHGIRSELRSNVIMLQDLLRQGVVHEKYKNNYAPMKLFRGVESMSPQEMLGAIERSFDDLARIGYFHTKNSECSSIFQMIVFLVFVGDQQEWSPLILQDVARLLTVDKASVDVESAGVPIGLQKLSNAIFATQGWRETFALADTATAMCWLNENLHNEQQDFLEKFGHRCLKEFELLSRPWEEDMSPVVSTLQTMLKGGNIRAQESSPDASETATEKPVQTGSHVKDFLLSLLVPLAHQSVGRREESKSMLIKAVHQIRLAYRALAQALVKENLMPSEELVVFLSHYELRQLVVEHRTDLIPKAVRRRKLLGRLEHLEFPEIVIGCQVEDSNVVANHKPGEGDLIVGTPACPGKVTGSARVITRLDQAADIQPGDILITTSTDIGWSPYFPMLGGVVTELGGLISHGAVVAREYGLPCLVGARGATKTFSSGDLVRIDTEQGILYKIYT